MKKRVVKVADPWASWDAVAREAMERLTAPC